MTTREEVHRLVDAVPDDRLEAASGVVQAAFDPGLTHDVIHRFDEALHALRASESALIQIQEHRRAELESPTPVVVRTSFYPGPASDVLHRLDEALHALRAFESALIQINEQRRPFLPPSTPKEDESSLATEPVRTFASTGALSAEHDLAERVEDILRTEDHDAA